MIVFVSDIISYAQKTVVILAGLLVCSNSKQPKNYKQSHVCQHVSCARISLVVGFLAGKIRASPASKAMQRVTWDRTMLWSNRPSDRLALVLHLQTWDLLPGGNATVQLIPKNQSLKSKSENPLWLSAEPSPDLPVIDFHLCLEVATRVITCRPSSTLKSLHQLDPNSTRADWMRIQSGQPIHISSEIMAMKMQISVHGVYRVSHFKTKIFKDFQ